MKTISVLDRESNPEKYQKANILTILNSGSETMSDIGDSAKCLEEWESAKGGSESIEKHGLRRTSSFSVKSIWHGRKHRSSSSVMAVKAATIKQQPSREQRRRATADADLEFWIPENLPLSWAAVPQKVNFTPRRHSTSSADSGWRDETSEQKKSNSAQRALRLFLELESTRNLRGMAASALATPPTPPPATLEENLRDPACLRRAVATDPRNDGDGTFKHTSMEEDTVGLQAGLGPEHEGDKKLVPNSPVDAEIRSGDKPKRRRSSLQKICSLLRKNWSTTGHHLS